MDEKRMAGQYEIIHAVSVGDREVVFGRDEKNEMPYLCAFYAQNEFLASYEECIASNDYVEMMELFSERIAGQCEKVRGEWEKVTVPREPVTQDMCIPLRQCGDLKGKIMAVRADALKPEYRSADHQFVYVTGGNGAREGAFGNACFCTNIYSGKSVRWERYDLQGEVKEECLPQWVKEKAVEIRKAEKTGQKQTREAR